jgi:hypothetical protein
VVLVTNGVIPPARVISASREALSLCQNRGLYRILADHRALHFSGDGDDARALWAHLDSAGFDQHYRVAVVRGDDMDNDPFQEFEEMCRGNGCSVRCVATIEDGVDFITH